MSRQSSLKRETDKYNSSEKMKLANGNANTLIFSK